MLVNKYNDQFIAPKTSSKAGVICSSPSLMNGGGSYGITSDSINADIVAGLGKSRPSAVGHYKNCSSQKGGAAGHNYDADAVGQTYGYTKAGAAYAGEVRGGYAPITVQPKTNMCGGKKKRRKSKKKRKNKSRKSRKRRKSKKRRKSRRRRKRRGGMGLEMGKIDMNEKKRTLRRELKAEYNARDRYAADSKLAMENPLGLPNSAKAIAKLEKDYKDKYGDKELDELKENYKDLVCKGVFPNYGGIHKCGKKGGKRRRRKSRKKSKSNKKRKRRTRRRMKGGRYQQYGSNVPNTPSYSGPYTAGPMPWATGPVGINRQINC